MAPVDGSTKGMSLPTWTAAFVGSERCVETGEHALPRGGLLRERRRVREAQLPDVVELYADLDDEGDGVLALQPARDRVP